MNMRNTLLSDSAYFSEEALDEVDSLDFLFDRLDDESFFDQDHYIDPLTFDLLE